jgi:hypothetical protein
MDALKKSIASESAPAKSKKPRKAAVGQTEMLLPIEGKRGAEKKQPSPSGQPDDVKQDSESRITPASPRRDCKM